MNYIKFTDVHPGDSFDRPVLVSSYSESIAKNGKTFLKFKIKDGYSDVMATMFDTNSAIMKANGIEQDTIADVKISVNEYQGTPSYIINDIQRSVDSTISINDFIKLPPIDINTMFNEIIDIVKNSNKTSDKTFDPISILTIKILEDYKEQYITSSAAISMHHNLRGGIIYHSYRMVKRADCLCNIYDSLDREILVCGAALHDIGKIWEYKTSISGEAEFTKSGVLFGHLYLGANLISKYVKTGNYNPERIRHLIHLILSHHGSQEYGAVVAPATAEAFTLHFIDNMDARIYACNDIQEGLDKGSITDKKPFGFENRIYNPK